MAKVEIKRMTEETENEKEVIEMTETEEGIYEPKKENVIGKIKNGIKAHKKKIACAGGVVLALAGAYLMGDTKTENGDELYEESEETEEVNEEN